MFSSSKSSPKKKESSQNPLPLLDQEIVDSETAQILQSQNLISSLKESISQQLQINYFIIFTKIFQTENKQYEIYNILYKLIPSKFIFSLTIDLILSIQINNKKVEFFIQDFYYFLATKLKVVDFCEIDFLVRFKRYETLIDLLCSKKEHLLDAVLFCREFGLLKFLNPEKILSRAKDDDLMFYNLYKFMEQRNLYLFQSNKFDSGLEEYAELFNSKFG